MWLSPFRKESQETEKAENPGKESAVAPSKEIEWIDVPHAIQSFGMELLRQECAARPEQNVFVSPLSVFLALAMAENGAGGETKAAMRRVLRVPPEVEAGKVNEEAKRLSALLQSKGGIELSIGNALWTDTGFPLAPEFVALCAECFDAVARTLDMKSPASAEVINRWIAEKTQGKILQIVDARSLATTTTVITNAVYFKGKFLIPFPRETTQPKAFHLADGREKLVPMMHDTGSAQYRRGKTCEAAALRYGARRGRHAPPEVELILALPDSGTSPEAIFRDDLPGLFRDPDERIELDLFAPRFSMSFEGRLNQSLAKMGMGIAMKFPGADFVPMGSDLFFIESVLHKTRLEVDEEGTTAAAATSAGMLLASVRKEPKRKTLVFDRPFALMIRDTASGTVLFAGVVYEP